VGFREDFQVLSRGDDFYFLTRSGKLYVAPKPARGRNRVMRPVWIDAKRRIETFVTDADTRRTFLFCRQPPGAASAAFFELGGKPALVEYDPVQFRPGK